MLGKRPAPQWSYEDVMLPPKAPRFTNIYHDLVVVCDASPDLRAPLALVCTRRGGNHVARIYVPSGTTQKYRLHPGEGAEGGARIPAAIGHAVLMAVCKGERRGGRQGRRQGRYAARIHSDVLVDFTPPSACGASLMFASRRLFEADIRAFCGMLACRRTVAARAIQAFAAKWVLTRKPPPEAPACATAYHDIVVVCGAAPDLRAPLALVQTRTDRSAKNAVRIYAPSRTTEKHFPRPGEEGGERAVAVGAHVAAAVGDAVLEALREEGGGRGGDYAARVRGGCLVDATPPEARGDAVVFASRPLFEASAAGFRAVLACRRTLRRMAAARRIEAFSARWVYARAGGAWGEGGVNRTTRHLAAAYIARYPEVDALVSLPYPEARALLGGRGVLEAAGGFLGRVLALINRGTKGNGRPRVTGTVSVRVLTAGSLAVAHPAASFEEVGGAQRGLLEAAAPLLSRLAQAAEELRAGEGWAKVQACAGGAPPLPSVVCTYLSAYLGWRREEDGAAAGRIAHAIRVLEEERAKLSEGADAALLAGLDAQQGDLGRRLAALQRPPPPSPQQRARVRGAEAERPGGGRRGAEEGAGVGGYSSEQVAHELMLDGSFRVTLETATAEYRAGARVRGALERARALSIADDLAAEPPRLGGVVGVLGEFRERLRGLARTRRTREAVGALLDVGRIAADLAGGRAPPAARGALLRGLGGLVVRVHAELADAWGGGGARETGAVLAAAGAALGEARGARGAALATCEYLEAVRLRIEAVRLDLRNLRLHRLLVSTAGGGVGHLRESFKRLQAAGEVTLRGTRDWIAGAVRGLEGDPDAGVTARQLLEGRPEDYVRVLRCAAVDMVASGTGDPPETFRLDGGRVRALREEFRRDVRAFSVLSSVHQVASARAPGHAAAAVGAASGLLAPAGGRGAPLGEVRGALEAAGVPGGAVAEVMAVVARNEDPSSAVGAAAAKVIRRAWLGILRDGRFPLDAGFPRAAGAMRDGMVGRCAVLGRMVGLSSDVYTAEYNAMILAAARAALAPP